MNNTDHMVADSLRGSWVHRFLPQSLWPYAQLARWERPIGWKLLMWPCQWSLMLAVAHRAGAAADSYTWAYGLNIALFVFLFLAGAFVMRGAGCTYNDLVDQDIDDKVARTRSRPLPSGRVTRRQAAVFLALQLLAGLLILLQFNPYAIVTGIVSLVTVVIYPFMKRITWWPQLFLGLAFSWGALMGWAAVEGGLAWPPLLLYWGAILWVIGYDTIYAHQDIEDDALVGVKSTARLFAENTRPALAALYAGALVLFSAAFWLAGISWIAWLGLVAGAAHMVWQITTVDIHDPANCLVRFKSNSGFGWILFLALLASMAVAG
ncbi:MAG: 4-hydroxybenzoate octaprenyltransferase [Nitratireductor sp.]|nr:4-hydroxybenzoate octaprenyltransferase [Nitratireductor sp.]